ncbi:MAG: hypothetical protein H7145_23815 [Akkermansiaceae bacterium]|nr:hypothetical protein [Armatimonadota bacterium]
MSRNDQKEPPPLPTLTARRLPIRIYQSDFDNRVSLLDVSRDVVFAAVVQYLLVGLISPFVRNGTGSPALAILYFGFLYFVVLVCLLTIIACFGRQSISDRYKRLSIVTVTMIGVVSVLMSLSQRVLFSTLFLFSAAATLLAAISAVWVSMEVSPP